MEVRFVDEMECGFGWIAAEPPILERASHVLVDEGKVWLVDPIDGDDVEERIRAAGRPVGILQLVDRHERDSAAFAERFGVPVHQTPFSGVAGAPFQVIPLVRRRFWSEVALWFAAERILVCGDALGTAAYYRAGDERLAVNPALRVLPPRQLGDLEPRHVLVGHGEGIHGDDAAAYVREAVATARRRSVPWAASLARQSLRRVRRRS